MELRAGLVSGVLALCAVSGCASDSQTALRSLVDNPLENDGRILDVTIFPYDGGSRDEYIICWERCSAEEARTSPSAITPRVRGEFDDFHGDRPVHVRVRFEAYCFKPRAQCAEVSFFFQEIE